MESTPSPCVQDIKRTLFTNFHALFHKIIPILLIAYTKLGLLKFDDLYKLDINLLAHDCLYGNAPKNIRSLTTLAQNSNHNLRNQASKPLSLKVPNFKSRAGTHSFRQLGSISWNSVPSEVQAINQKVRF